MTDQDNPQRPNANYKLSKPDMTKDEAEKTLKHESLTFHYNRERRLEKAPQAVRDLYNKKKRYSSFNLFRPLVADKPRAILFFTILLMCAAIYILSIVDKLGVSSYLLDGNRILVTGARYEGTTIVVIKKTVASRRTLPYTGAVDVIALPVITALEGDFPTFFHRIYFTPEPEEEYRFIVPFDSSEQVIVLQTEMSSINLKFTPE